jgi:hypothetical protein
MMHNFQFPIPQWYRKVSLGPARLRFYENKDTPALYIKQGKAKEQRYNAAFPRGNNDTMIPLFASRFHTRIPRIAPLLGPPGNQPTSPCSGKKDIENGKTPPPAFE